MMSLKTKRRVGDAVVSVVAICIGLIVIFPGGPGLRIVKLRERHESGNKSGV